MREEAGTVGIPSIVVKAANPLRIKSVNDVFTLTLMIEACVSQRTAEGEAGRSSGLDN